MKTTHTTARIPPLEGHELCSEGKALLDQYAKATGLRPNIVRTLAHAPNVLCNVMGMFDSFRGGALDVELMEQVALAVAQANGCTYCVSAHAAIGTTTGLDPDRIDDSRWGVDDCPRRQAVLSFTRKVVIRRGAVDDADIQGLREAGFSDTALVELVAFISLHTMLNLLAETAQTPLDFPRVALDGPCTGHNDC